MEQPVTFCITFLFYFKGNLKAAITADVIQGITMIIISFGVIAQGIYESGGVEKAYVINKEHGMHIIFNISSMVAPLSIIIYIIAVIIMN